MVFHPSNIISIWQDLKKKWIRFHASIKVLEGKIGQKYHLGNSVKIPFNAFPWKTWYISKVNSTKKLILISDNSYYLKMEWKYVCKMSFP